MTPSLSLQLDWTLIYDRLSLAATTPQKRIMLTHLLSGLRKEAPFLPTEYIVMELICIAVGMSDSAWLPDCSTGSEIGRAPSSSP